MFLCLKTTFHLCIYIYIYICIYIYIYVCLFFKVVAAQKFIELGPYYDEKSAALIDKVAGLIAWSIPMIEATNAMRHNFRLVTQPKLLLRVTVCVCAAADAAAAAGAAAVVAAGLHICNYT